MHKSPPEFNSDHSYEILIDTGYDRIHRFPRPSTYSHNNQSCDELRSMLDTIEGTDKVILVDTRATESREKKSTGSQNMKICVDSNNSSLIRPFLNTHYHAPENSKKVKIGEFLSTLTRRINRTRNSSVPEAYKKHMLNFHVSQLSTSAMGDATRRISKPRTKKNTALSFHISELSPPLVTSTLSTNLSIPDEQRPAVSFDIVNSLPELLRRPNGSFIPEAQKKWSFKFDLAPQYSMEVAGNFNNAKTKSQESILPKFSTFIASCNLSPTFFYRPNQQVPRPANVFPQLPRPQSENKKLSKSLSTESLNTFETRSASGDLENKLVKTFLNFKLPREPSNLCESLNNRLQENENYGDLNFQNFKSFNSNR